jgi:RNA polymerase sigma-70 factor (ECF subfamily)
MPPDDPLPVLLNRMTAGDSAAAEKVFLAYEPYLRKIVRRQLKPHLRRKFDSVDVVQSVWADLLRGWGVPGRKVPTADYLRAYLVRATRNRFIDRVRQHRAALAHERPSPPADLAEFGTAPTPPASEVAQADELWEQMLAVCPPEHRRLLELRRNGCTLDEVAARAGLHEGSVRRIFRTLARRLAFRPPAEAI